MTRRLILLAHCLLNGSAKLRGNDAPAVLEPLVLPLIREGFGVIQLPCPETTYLGLRRWGMTSEQYDTPPFRRHCRRILEPLLDQVEDSLREGFRVAGVVGPEGSPSCGVGCTCGGFCGGEPAEGVPEARRIPGPGVFMDQLRLCLEERGLFLPFAGVDEGNPEGCRPAALSFAPLGAFSRPDGDGQGGSRS